MNATKNRRLTAALAAAALAGAALAATSAVKFSINGKPVASAINVDGKTYVPVSALQAAGFQITATAQGVSLTTAQAAGGANQMTAVEGCLGQTLFNGVWRLTVKSVAPAVVFGSPGLLLTFEMANGSKGPQNVDQTGFDAYALATPDGNTGAWAMAGGTNGFAGHDVPQGGKFTQTFQFWPSDRNVPNPPAPSKFLMHIDTKYVDRAKVPYSVPDPSFRVDLTCKK